MTTSRYKQLNPFELKTAVGKLLCKINSVNDIQNCLADFDMLDAQEDKKFISKILFKELVSASVEKIPVICFLLEHFVPKDELVAKLWETLKNQNLHSETKITILNLLREFDSDWSYQSCEEYLDDDAKGLLDENTKHLLNSAIINPEVQIDFMDFMASIRVQDKITLINSLSEDFTSDALANILIPVFISEPDSPAGKEALKLLADTKSVLALHTLEEMKTMASGELLQEIKRSLSTIKISGMREDNTKEFYKKILSSTKPHKCYITYPDGHGDMAMIFTRITDEKKFRFVSIVINVKTGIKDCFGFFEISEFECSKILERFLNDEKTSESDFRTFKTILHNAEITTIKRNQNSWKLPYEYVCWKTLLLDVDFDNQPIDEIMEEQIIPAKPKNGFMEKLSDMGITAHWFLDYQYSNEFENLLKKIKSASSLDELVNTELDSVFYSEEKEEWVEKLVMCAYLRYSTGADSDAQILYGISKDENALKELFTNILKRSIYEYLMIVKYDKTVETYGLTHEEIEGNIKYIEEKWVRDV